MYEDIITVFFVTISDEMSIVILVIFPIGIGPPSRPSQILFFQKFYFNVPKSRSLYFSIVWSLLFLSADLFEQFWNNLSLFLFKHFFCVSNSFGITILYVLSLMWAVFSSTLCHLSFHNICDVYFHFVHRTDKINDI